MENTNPNRHPIRPSPLPTWNAIHDPPSDDENTNVHRGRTLNLNRLRHISPDSDDDDVDMLDRASVAPPPPRSSAPSRPGLGSGSGSAHVSRRPGIASSSTTQSGSNTNANINTPANTTTNTNTSTSTSRPSWSLGLLKRKDKEHAVESDPFAKRKKLSTNLSNVSPVPTPTHPRLPRPLTAQTARKSTGNAYGADVLGGAGAGGSGSALELNSTTASASGPGVGADVGNGSSIHPRPRTKQTARKSTSSPVPKVDRRAMLPPAVPRPRSATGGSSGSVPSMTASTSRTPGASAAAITTPKSTPTTARQTDDEMDDIPSSSSSPVAPRQRPRPVARPSGSVGRFSAGVLNARNSWAARPRADSTSKSAAGLTAAGGSGLAWASTTNSTSTSASAPTSTRPKPKLTPKPSTEVIEISSGSEDDDAAPSASALVNLKSRPRPKPTFLSTGKSASSSTNANAKSSTSNANAKPSSSSSAKPSSSSNKPSSSSNPTNPNSTTKPTTANANANSRSSSPVSASSIVSARSSRRVVLARKSTGGRPPKSYKGLGGAGLSEGVEWSISDSGLIQRVPGTGLGAKGLRGAGLSEGVEFSISDNGQIRRVRGAGLGAGAGAGGSVSAGPGVRRGSPMSVIELSSDDDDDGAAGAKGKAKAKEKPTTSNVSASGNEALARQKEEEKQKILGRIAKLHEEIDDKLRAEEEMMRGREVVSVDDDNVDGENVNEDGDRDIGGVGGGVGDASTTAPVVEIGEVDVQMHVEHEEVAAVTMDKGKGKEKANDNEDIEMNAWMDEDLQLVSMMLDTDVDDMVVDDDSGAGATPTVSAAIQATPQAAPAPALHASIAPPGDIQSGIVPSSLPATDPQPSAHVTLSTHSPKPTPFAPAAAPPVTISPPKFPNRTTATNAKPGSSGRPGNILAQIATKSTGRSGMPRMVPSSVSPPSGSGDEEGSGSGDSGSDSDDEGSEESEREERVEDSEVEGGEGVAAEIEAGADGEAEMSEHETRMQVDAAKDVTPPPSKTSIGVKQQVLSPVVPRGPPSKNPKPTHMKPESKKRQQTLAEAITMTGKANVQQQRRREQLAKERELLTKTLRNVGNKPDVPIDLTSDVEDEDGAQEKTAVDDDKKQRGEKGENRGEVDDGDSGPPPTTASSVGSFGGAGGNTQISASGFPASVDQLPSASAVPVQSQVNEKLLNSSRNLVNMLKQKAAAKKQMRYTPSTPSSGHPSLSPPTVSPDQPNNTTSIDASIQSMMDAGVEVTSTPVPLSSPPIPAPSPPISNLGPSPVQITPLTQAVGDLGLMSGGDAASSIPKAASANSFSDMIPPSLSRVGGPVGGGSSPPSVSQLHSNSPNRADSAKRTPMASPARSQLSSPQSVQVPTSPRSHIASPPQVSLGTSPYHSPVHSAGLGQSFASPQSDSGQHSPMHQSSPLRSPAHVTTPQRSPAHITSPRRSSFASPSHKEFGHRRIPSAPNSTQMFASTSKTGSSPLGGGAGPISSSKPASPSPRSRLVSPTSASSPSAKMGESEGPRPEQAGKPLLPTRIPARPTGIMSMSAVPTMASVQLSSKPLESSSGISQRRAGSVDAVGPSLNADSMGAPITKIVQPRTETIIEQPLGVPAVAAPEVGMRNVVDEDDDDFYVDDSPADVPRLPPASDDDDEAMAEIQELVITTHSDEEMMDVDYDNPLPHPPISEIPSSAGTPSSLDLSGPSPSRPNGFERRVTRRSSSNQSDELFDRGSSPESSRRTTPEEGGIAAATTSTQQHQQPFGPVAKSYGGFPLLFWPEERRNMRTYSKLAEPKYARDLPHKLQDHINSMSAHTQLFEGMRDIFEATIQENTAEDEPDAPPIKIINDVDDEPTPPWEFYYTNTMWHGEGVPPPDIENLQGCDCEGVCGSKSKTCSCLARQREVTFEKDLDWVYDKNGRLNRKAVGYPIYECNERCGCGEECRNRVVQHGRKVEINIQKTPEKGWGVFAGAKKIPRGTFIGIYSGEIITNSEAHVRGIKYNKFGRTYLFDIDFYHLKTSKNWKSDLTVDAYHAGNFTRFLNHSCDPNCRLYACYTNEGNIKKPLLAIFAIRDIEPHEEICFSYSGDYPGEEEDDEEEEEEMPGPSQESNNKDEDGDDENDNDNENDRIWEVCRCGAANCRGGIFVRR